MIRYGVAGFLQNEDEVIEALEMSVLATDMMTQSMGV